MAIWQSFFLIYVLVSVLYFSVWTLLYISISMKAPYFKTIRPKVVDLRVGYSEVCMKQRWGVQNHIQTVHAIAVCNLVEMTMGLVAESTIPTNLRWLPKGMDVSYVKKATGKLTGKAEISPDFFELKVYPGDVAVPITVTNEQNQIVCLAKVHLYITEKPGK